MTKEVREGGESGVLAPRDDTKAPDNDPLTVLRDIRRWMLNLPIPTIGATYRVRLMDAVIAKLEKAATVPDMGIPMSASVGEANTRDERAVTDNGRDAVIEECAEVAHTHREKGPWCGKELVVWRRACAQVEDAIRALSKDRGEARNNTPKVRG